MVVIIIDGNAKISFSKYAKKAILKIPKIKAEVINKRLEQIINGSIISNGCVRCLFKGVYELKVKKYRICYVEKNNQLKILYIFVKSTTQTPKYVLRNLSQQCS